MEAGLRSFNRRMPEEINRVLTDHVSELLFCPSKTAVDNLAAEGITKGVHIVGDVMLDILTWAKERTNGKGTGLLQRLALTPGKYLVATVHRGENTDDPRRLGGIVQALNSMKEDVVFPIHPRTRKAMNGEGGQLGSHVRLIEPLVVKIAGLEYLLNLSIAVFRSVVDVSHDKPTRPVHHLMPHIQGRPDKCLPFALSHSPASATAPLQWGSRPLSCGWHIVR